jgi:hypothetical protein
MLAQIFQLLDLLQYVTFFFGLIRNGFTRILDILILIFSL